MGQRVGQDFVFISYPELQQFGKPLGMHVVRAAIVLLEKIHCSAGIEFLELAKMTIVDRFQIEAQMVLIYFCRRKLLK